jgi:uncharacterized DUF497 family protein
LTAEHHFEWDTEKANRNVKKHRVSFEEAATVFDDPKFITFVDDEHSIDEERYITLGLSSRGRFLMLAHADRGDRIRIVSARRATKKEEQFYADTD